MKGCRDRIETIPLIDDIVLYFVSVYFEIYYCEKTF